MMKRKETNGKEPGDLESMRDRIRDLETGLADSRDLMDSMRDPVLVLDADLRVVSANRAYYSTFKVRLKEVEGRLLVELGGDRWDIPELIGMLNEVLEKDTSFDAFEVDREFEKIGRRIMLLNARRIDRGPGKPHRIVLVIEDATVSRLMKNAIEESEAFHRSLLENVTDAVFLADDSGRIVYAGGNVQEIFKKSAEEIQGLGNIEALLGKDLFDPEGLSRKGEIANIEREVTDASGQKHALLISVKRVALRQGTLLYTCRDYTEGKEQERRLSEALAQLGAVYAHAPVAMILVDRERRVTEANGFAARFAGRTAEEMIGLRGGEALRCLHHLDDPEGCGFGPVCQNCMVRLAVLDTFRAKKSREHIETWLPFLTNRGSEERCLSVSTAYLEYEGNERVLVCVQDITESKLREEELKGARDTAVLRQKELNGLLGASRAVHELVGFKTAARKVFDAAKRLLGASSGYVALLSETGDENEVLFLDSGGLSCTVDPYLPMPIRGLRGEAYRLGKAVFDNDFEKSPWMRFMPQGHVRLKNVLFAPLMLEGKAVGLLGLANKEEGFTYRDAQLAQSFAGLAAVALKNAREMELRAKSEESLRKSEEEYRLLFESANVGILIAQDGYIKKSNPYVSRMLGYGPGELDGQPLSRVIHPEDQSLVMTRHYELLRGQSDLPQTYEFRVVSKNGTTLWHKLRTVRIEWRGRPATLNFINDITERKRVEEALRESEEKYRSLFNQSTEGIYLHDLEGRILDVNEMACAQSGYSREEWLRRTVFDGHPSKSTTNLPKDEILRIWKEEWKPGQQYTIESEHQRKDGTVYPVEISTGIVRYRGAKAILAIVKDITERKRAEEERERLQSQLLQAQRLESVGRLAGGVAHDFNNMLNVILGYGEILLDQLLPGDPMRNEVEQIMEAGKRSAALTRQLLAFSRKQTLQPEVIDLNKVIRNMEKMLRRLIGEDIELQLELKEDIARVMADPGQMEQVIMNLAVNARDAMSQGGKLLLETADVDLDEDYARTHAGVTPGKYVMLAVTDTGSGMDKETLTQIFEPFFSTKEKAKGTGLGLSTVYGIVKQSGGNIWAYSEPGQGATFKIYLPETEAKPEERRIATKEEAVRGSGEPILVVEDEENLRNLMGTILSRLGYKVTLAANGGEALLLMEKKGLKPDLVITDVIMPNMSGKELVDRLRKTQPDLKVLYMSGYTDNAIVHHGVLDPGIPFIQKPFTLRDIAEKVQAVLRGE